MWQVRPLFTELTNNVQPGKNVIAAFKKTVDSKLPEPYSNCKDDINQETSPLVRQILEQNMTYRKTNCYDLCLNNYAAARNISKQSIYELQFNYPGNCSQHCPLECLSNIFEVSEGITYFDEQAANFVWINFFYNDNQYTELTQSVKTTVADLVSNIGGLLGLFLELSFMSAYRLVINAFGLKVAWIQKGNISFRLVIWFRSYIFYELRLRQLKIKFWNIYGVCFFLLELFLDLFESKWLYEYKMR